MLAKDFRNEFKWSLSKELGPADLLRETAQLHGDLSRLIHKGERKGSRASTSKNQDC